jgi:uncharacterized Zn finger protein (UPF0148 family)
VRRHALAENPVLCPSCGLKCVNIGYKIHIPPKNKNKEWEKLRIQLTNEKIKTQSNTVISNVRHVHELEKEIAKLEALPENKGRASLIKKLKRQLEARNA